MIHRFLIGISSSNGTPRAQVDLDGAGKRHLGIQRFVLSDGTDAVLPDHPTWDCREWQWWAGYDGSTEMRPRTESAVCGGSERDDVAEVWSEYLCDGVRTRHVWTVPTVQEPPSLGYDCFITVTNETGTDLREYGQFFACYTSLNRTRGKRPARSDAIGCWFWDGSGSLVNFLAIGGYHIDRLIVDPESVYSKIGMVPHCPRGDGRVGGVWTHPVIVSHPAPGGERHIILLEPGTTAAVCMGMGGLAMDYIVFPGSLVFAAGSSSRTRVRHYVMPLPEGKEIERLSELWAEFEIDLHQPWPTIGPKQAK